MVVRTISHRNTVHIVTNVFVMILFSPLNAELTPICHLLTLLGAHHILHVSRISVNTNLPSEFKSSLPYPITIFIAFSFFPIRARCPDGLSPWLCLAKATNYEVLLHYIFFILSLPVSKLTKNVGTGRCPERNKHSLLKILLFSHLSPGLLFGDFPSAIPNKFYINFAVSWPTWHTNWYDLCVLSSMI
jgi:hypothetical protein